MLQCLLLVESIRFCQFPNKNNDRNAPTLDIRHISMYNVQQ